MVERNTGAGLAEIRIARNAAQGAEEDFAQLLDAFPASRLGSRAQRVLDSLEGRLGAIRTGCDDALRHLEDVPAAPSAVSPPPRLDADALLAVMRRLHREGPMWTQDIAHTCASRRGPTPSTAQVRRLLERLERQGRVRRVVAGNPSSWIFIPEAARDAPA